MLGNEGGGRGVPQRGAKAAGKDKRAGGSRGSVRARVHSDATGHGEGRSLAGRPRADGEVLGT
eukprot:6686131-Pyramimonas_sp.AAC.1